MTGASDWVAQRTRGCTNCRCQPSAGAMRALLSSGAVLAFPITSAPKSATDTFKHRRAGHQSTSRQRANYVTVREGSSRSRAHDQALKISRNGLFAESRSAPRKTPCYPRRGNPSSTDRTRGKDKIKDDDLKRKCSFVRASSIRVTRCSRRREILELIAAKAARRPRDPKVTTSPKSRRCRLRNQRRQPDYVSTINFVGHELSTTRPGAAGSDREERWCASHL